MADIVPSLFGLTPGMYQQAQQQRGDEMALQYAKLDPFQQANYAIGRGAYGLAGAAGGLLGGQDPELQRITRRQQIAQQINPNDLSTFQQAIAALAPTDPQGAMMVRAELEKTQLAQAKLASEQALTTQRLRETKGADPIQQLLRSGKFKPSSIATYERTGKIEDLENLDVNDPTVVTETAEGIGLFNKNTGELIKTLGQAAPPKPPTEDKPLIQQLQEYAAKLPPSSREFAQVQAKIKALGEPGGTKVEVRNVMPGDKNLADIPAFRASVQRTIAPQLKTITATDQALQAIDDSLATNNFAAYRAAQVQFARAIAGAGDLSQKELKAAGADPSLLGGTADYLSTLFSSTPTADTQKKIRSTLQAIRTVSQKQASNEVEQQRKIALRSPAYDPEAVKEALMFPELLPSTSLPPTATGSMAEQAAAEIKRRAAARQTSGGR